VRALVLQTEDRCPGGTIAGALTDAGIDLVVWRTDLERPPENLDGFSAVLALGGGVHPDQDGEFAWLARERALLSEAVRREVPTLGVCLGAQLLAQATGASVYALEPPEIGWADVASTVASYRDRLYRTLPPVHRVLEWHSYGFSLPPGAELLSGTPRVVQAFRVGERAWGFQYHLEANAAIVGAWVDHYEAELRARGVDPARLTAETVLRAPLQERYARALGAEFARIVAERPADAPPTTSAA
jgi:GMP synthase-like glutamine amidotransferase